MGSEIEILHLEGELRVAETIKGGKWLLSNAYSVPRPVPARKLQLWSTINCDLRLVAFKIYICIFINFRERTGEGER